MMNIIEYMLINQFDISFAMLLGFWLKAVNESLSFSLFVQLI